jgi:hypothetical protein
MRLHSFSGAAFFGRSHLPALLQQLFSAVGNMKNCGHEMHPPQNKVAVTSRDSTELEMARGTTLVQEYQYGGAWARHQRFRLTH